MRHGNGVQTRNFHDNGQAIHPGIFLVIGMCILHFRCNEMYVLF